MVSLGLLLEKFSFSKKALYGIALKRGKDLGEECTPKAALQAL